jgi:type II secretory pathway predicted ATPase ExeA
MYREHFGFCALAFTDAPEPHSFYWNPVYQTAFVTLRHGVLAKKGVIVLTAATGTGKTVLLRKLFDDLGPSVKPIWVVGSGDSVAGVLRTALAELNLKPESTEPTAMIDAFHRFLIQSANSKNIICMIIEEAQNLDSETLEGLRQLSNFEAEGQKLLQLILVGHQEFMRTLDKPELWSLKQRVALHCRLFPLSQGEVGRYIEFQLDAAGYQGERLFDPSAVARIAHYSGGIPRLVNTICDNALRSACRSVRKEVSQKLIDEVAMDMHLVDYQRASPATAFDREGWIDRKEPPPDPQIETIWSNFQFDSAPARSTMIAKPPRRRVTSMIGAALLALVTLGAVGWAVHVYEAMPFLEYLRAQVEVVKSGYGHLDESAKSETANQSSLQQPAVADSRSAALDDGQANVGAISEAENLRETEESVPARQKFQEKQRDNQIHSPATSARKDRPDQNPAVRRRFIEIEIQRAIQNRAIEGVSVKLIGGTAYLGGQVASEQQRSMAERAALGVQEVASVENHIEIRP